MESDSYGLQEAWPEAVFGPGGMTRSRSWPSGLLAMAPSPLAPWGPGWAACSPPGLPAAGLPAAQAFNAVHDTFLDEAPAR